MDFLCKYKYDNLKISQAQVRDVILNYFVSMLKLFKSKSKVFSLCNKAWL
jgi:hypothetical protein